MAEEREEVVGAAQILQKKKKERKEWKELERAAKTKGCTHEEAKSKPTERPTPNIILSRRAKRVPVSAHRVQFKILACQEIKVKPTARHLFLKGQFDAVYDQQPIRVRRAMRERETQSQRNRPDLWSYFMALRNYQVDGLTFSFFLDCSGVLTRSALIENISPLLVCAVEDEQQSQTRLGVPD
jgi:hypothetical protein